MTKMRAFRQNLFNVWFGLGEYLFKIQPEEDKAKDLHRRHWQ